MRHGRKIFGCHIDDLVPQDVAVARGVRLGCTRELATTIPSTFERMAYDPLDAHPGENAGLDSNLTGLTPVDPATDARVFTLRVLAHEQHVDVLRCTTRQRGRNTREQAHGPQVRP